MTARSGSSFSEMIAGLDNELTLELTRARSSFKHNGLRGDGPEGAVRTLLHDHLPRNFGVGTGEIVDTHEQRSRETDVVIYNEYQPFRSELHQAALFLIEGVSAAGEVKSRLTTDELRDSLRKAAAHKSLRSIYADRDVAEFQNPAHLKHYKSPPYFLFAFENEVAEATILRMLNDAPLVAPGSPPGMVDDELNLRPIDAVFILGRGCVLDYGDGEGDLQFTFDEGVNQGGSATGYVWHPSGSVVANLLLWLGAVIPRVQRSRQVALPYLIKLSVGEGTTLDQ